MMAETILSVIFAAFVLVLELYHGRERKELYSRLTCRDASEYHRITEKKRERRLPPYVISAKKWRDTEGRGDQ